MMRTAGLSVAVLAAVVLAGCHSSQSRSASQEAAWAPVAEGTVVHVGEGFGNLYTNIKPDRYEALGLEDGRYIRVAFADTVVDLVVGEHYEAVPSGTPVAVLHREGLTFAVRDGDFSDTYGVALGAPFTISIAPDRR